MTGTSVALVMVLSAAPAAAADWYSVGKEFGGTASITGLRTTRWDNAFTGVPADGCSQPAYLLSGAQHPVYQSQWIIHTNGTYWVELGTGLQCSGNFRYWFWFWQDDAGPHLGYRVVQNRGKHEFRIEQNQYYAWKWDVYIDVTRIDSFTFYGSWNGGQVEAGLESLAVDATHHVPIRQDFLQYRASGSWVQFRGKDDDFVDDPIACGHWGLESEWWYNQNVGSAC